MADGFFTVTVIGEETLQADLNEHLLAIKDASRAGLQFLASDMISTLQKHIWNDWHEPWGEPLVYKRRTDAENDPDQGYLGVPLGDTRNMSTEIRDLSLAFVYEPTGRHTTHSWSTVNGDALISIIQRNAGWKYEPGKDKDHRNVMPRPFWNNFVEDEKNGAAFGAFEYGFSGRGYDLIREGNDVVFDGNESMLPAR